MRKIQKKGNIEAIIYLMMILFVLLIGGVMLIFGAITIDWVFDEAVPELSTLGVVGNANLTEYSKYSIAPVNTVVQSFIWLAGVFYVLGLMGCIGFAFAFRFTGNKWLMGFFFACMLMLVMASIFMSNIYEEFYNGTDEVGTRLKEHELLSYLILYSPIVMSIIGFVCGIIMFTGEGGEVSI